MFSTLRLLVLLLPLASQAGAVSYRIEAAAAQGVSGQAQVLLIPFQDARRDREVYTSRNGAWENVVIDPAGRTSMAEAWKRLGPGDLSFLWHRQLAATLLDSGLRLQASELPLTAPQALAAAQGAGASYVLEGSIRKLRIDKRGHDRLLGTNISGTDYTLNAKFDLQLRDAGSGAVALTRSIAFQKKYYNPERMGSADRETFPHYFSRGLPEAALAVAADPELRLKLGLPTLTPSPTATATPETTPPAPGKDKPTPLPTPTPENASYWACPKCGRHMDPAWEICPFDGTKRKDFILKGKLP